MTRKIVAVKIKYLKKCLLQKDILNLITNMLKLEIKRFDFITSILVENSILISDLQMD